MPLTLRLAGLCALILIATPACAADFDGPYPPPGRSYDGPADYGRSYDGPDRELPPRPEPDRSPPRFGAGPRFERGPDPGSPETCRTFVRRGLDADGEPVLRRVRVCDEPIIGRDPPPPPEEVPPRRRFDPRW